MPAKANAVANWVWSKAACSRQTSRKLIGWGLSRSTSMRQSSSGNSAKASNSA